MRKTKSFQQFHFLHGIEYKDPYKTKRELNQQKALALLVTDQEKEQQDAEDAQLSGKATAVTQSVTVSETPALGFGFFDDEDDIVSNNNDK